MLSLVFRPLACMVLLASPLHAEEGDQLKVRVNIVNLRAEASEESEVVLKLGIGRQVTEIQRQGRWVQVATGREDIPQGWVSQGFLEPYQVADGVETLFDLFQLAFNEYQQSLQRSAQNTSPVTYFSAVTYLGDGDLIVAATPSWLARLDVERQADMDNIFSMWEAVVGVDRSRSVSIVDAEEQLLMLIMK